MSRPNVTGLDPHEQHLLVMAALATLHSHLADATSGPWRWADLDRAGYGLFGAGSRPVLTIPLTGRAPSHHDQAAIIAMRDQAYADTIGRRRLLERHAPTGRVSTGRTWCPAHGDRTPWPCLDYVDIARAHVDGLQVAS